MSAAHHPSLAGPAYSGYPVPASARMLLARLARLAWGRLTVAGPGGFRAEFGAAHGAAAHIEFRDWDICGEILTGGDNAFAEGYIQQRWDSPDLVALLTVAAHNP